MLDHSFEQSFKKINIETEITEQIAIVFIFSSRCVSNVDTSGSFRARANLGLKSMSVPSLPLDMDGFFVYTYKIYEWE